MTETFFEPHDFAQLVHALAQRPVVVCTSRRAGSCFLEPGRHCVHRVTRGQPRAGVNAV